MHGIEHESIPGDFVGVSCGEKDLPKILFDLWTRRRWGLLGMKRYIICTTQGCLPMTNGARCSKASKKYKWRERYGIDKRYRDGAG